MYWFFRSPIWYLLIYLNNILESYTYKPSKSMHTHTLRIGYPNSHDNHFQHIENTPHTHPNVPTLVHRNHA